MKQTAYVWQCKGMTGLQRFHETGKIESVEQKTEMIEEITVGLDLIVAYQEKLEAILQEKRNLQKLLEFVENSLDTTE